LDVVTLASTIGFSSTPVTIFKTHGYINTSQNTFITLELTSCVLAGRKVLTNLTYGLSSYTDYGTYIPSRDKITSSNFLPAFSYNLNNTKTYLKTLSLSPAAGIFPYTFVIRDGSLTTTNWFNDTTSGTTDTISFGNATYGGDIR